MNFIKRLLCLLFGHTPHPEFKRRGFTFMRFDFKNDPMYEFLPEQIRADFGLCGRCMAMYATKIEYPVERLQETEGVE